MSGRVLDLVHQLLDPGVLGLCRGGRQQHHQGDDGGGHGVARLEAGDWSPDL